ncbi:acyltransferase family protein [Nonomuraea turcica]|uniref:acyltransferase family protein n=1 Tax=Nonomuraea sp. G32 TaxID=3067274 RepID=UPI00273AD91A|nr:acyltransferase [Nonomuraea sp. G32]MDP4503771.1 acyltransferase [Nonomuraea sp. G32]
MRPSDTRTRSLRGPVLSPRAAPARIHKLDALRLVAAVSVVLFHYTFSGWADGTTTVAYPEMGSWTRYGYLGVDLFFMISGFVVLMSAWGATPRRFVVSRVARLYPAYWLAIAVTALVTVTLGRDLFPISAGQVLANLTMFQAVADVPNVDVVYWTLWAEMRFYVLILALTWIGITRSRVMAVLWGWLALTALVEAGLLPRVADLVVQSEFSHYFIAGMALFLARDRGFTWPIGLLLTLCAGNAIYRALGYADAVGRRYGVAYDHVVVITVVIALFAITTMIALGVTRRLGRPWLATAGTLTYPLYLLHAHIGFILINRVGATLDKYVLLAALLATMAAAAYAVHRLVERSAAPLIKRILG